MEYTHVVCLKNVEDDIGLYNIKGRVYEITEMLKGNRVRIETENFNDSIHNEIETALDDDYFHFFVMGDEQDETREV